MANNPDLVTYRYSYFEWVLVNLVIACFFVGIFTPATASLAWYLERKLNFNSFHLGLMVGSLVWSLFIAKAAHSVDFFSIWHWLYALPAAPVASGVLRGIYMLSHFTKPRSLNETLDEVLRHD